MCFVHYLCTENDKDIPVDFQIMLNELRSTGFRNSELGQIIIRQISAVIIPLFEEFRNEGRLRSPTFRLWDEFLFGVSLPLKLFIQST